LARFCNAQLPSLPAAPALTGIATPKDSKSWRLKSSVSVFRHADRTPKSALAHAFDDVAQDRVA
jgi:hypothetical protein